MVALARELAGEGLDENSYDSELSDTVLQQKHKFLIFPCTHPSDFSCAQATTRRTLSKEFTVRTRF